MTGRHRAPQEPVRYPRDLIIGGACAALGSGGPTMAARYLASLVEHTAGRRHRQSAAAAASPDREDPLVPDASCRCGRQWTGRSRAHCSACHETFSGITAFDAHRRQGACLEPAGMGLVSRDDVWSYPAPTDTPWWQQ